MTPILEFNNLWSEVLADETHFVQLYSNSSHFEVKSGISNGVEVILDLEIFDSADIGEVGDGLGIIIDNKDNYPLFNLNGISIEPGKLAMIRIQPKIYSRLLLIDLITRIENVWTLPTKKYPWNLLTPTVCQSVWLQQLTIRFV